MNDDFVENPVDPDKIIVTDGKSKNVVSVEKLKKFIDKASEENILKYSRVVDKAKHFLDNNYNFAGKSIATIMKDAVATQNNKAKFTDSELPIAFKLLQPKATSQYDSFGKNNDTASIVRELAEKEF